MTTYSRPLQISSLPHYSTTTIVTVRRVALGIVTIAFLTLALIWIAVLRPPPTSDIATLNRSVHLAQEHWPHLDEHQFSTITSAVTVIDSDGTVRLEANQDDNTAHLGADASTVGGLQKIDRAVTLFALHPPDRTLSAPIIVDGHIVGILLIDDLSYNAMQNGSIYLAQLLSMALVVMTLGTLGGIALLHHRVIVPFRRLEGFAQDIAHGRFDVPLPMDRGRIFGVWSEAFDLMRSELRSSREREQEAHRQQEQLVADISHDIRTPLATLTSTAELILATSPDPTRNARLTRLISQAQRIDSLLTDLEHSYSLSNPVLSVDVVEVPSSTLSHIVLDADPRSLVQMQPFPEVLVRVDPDRFAQIVGNIVANSYKYASTVIEVEAYVLDQEEFLTLTFSDHGDGVSDDDLPLLIARGFRGSNAKGTSGQGLGLHTASSLMERMGGSLDLERGVDGGLVVHLLLPLA